MASQQSYGLKKFMGREYMGMMRHTFLIDEEGKLERIYLKVKAATIDTLIRDLRELSPASRGSAVHCN